MATFRYIARSLSGAEISGILQGDSRNEILIWLRDKCYTPVALEEVSLTAGTKKGSRRLRIRSQDMASFCWQLNTMIDGGVTITDAIDTIIDDIDNRKLQQVLREVCEKMRAGEGFYDSLQGYPRVFNDFFRAMIRAGESSGTMNTVLARLADYYDRRDELNRKIQRAIAYPAFILAFVMFVLAVMMLLIVPQFMDMFRTFGSKLPAFTRGFMTVYQFIMRNAPIGIAGMAGIVLLIALYDRTISGHGRLCKLWLRLPMIGKIARYAFIATFGRSMATLLGAGVPVLSAIEIMEEMTSNTVIKGILTKARDQIAEGVGIALSMAGNSIFPSLVIKMVQVGEESGSLPQVLDRSSNYFEKKVDTTVMAMISILEPAMIIFVGAIVLLILLALYLPIFSLSDMGQTTQ
jgi:type IV pilus assembly protein PilC